jgi:hypothetical protein
MELLYLLNQSTGFETANKKIQPIPPIGMAVFDPEITSDEVSPESSTYHKTRESDPCPPSPAAP